VFRLTLVLLVGVIALVLVYSAEHPVSCHSSAGVTPDTSIVGCPSLSSSFVDRVLAAYHSPAVGLGAVLVQDSQVYSIDDAYALAFFWHESTFGRYGAAAATHSLGNIICAGSPTCIGRFRAYPSWADGATDWFRVLSHEYVSSGLTTPRRIVPVYAPSTENDVAAYIRAVDTAVSTWRAGRLMVGEVS